MKIICSVRPPLLEKGLTKFINDSMTKKHYVTFMCPSGIKGQAEEPSWLKAKTITSRTINLSQYFGYQLFASRVKRRVKGFNVHQGMGVLECLPFIKAKKQFMIWTDSLIEDKSLRSLTKPLLYKLEKKVLKSAKRVFTQTSHDARVVSNQLGINAEVINYPVNLKQFKPSSKQKKRYLITVRSQRVNDLIEAFNKVRMKLSDYELIILGERTSNDELINYYKEASLFIMPSPKKNFDPSIAQAMACGCPVICVDSPGAREAIKQDYNGYLVADNKPDALSNAIIDVLESNKLRNRFVKNGLRIVQKFDSRKIIKQLNKVYNELREN